jgi:hypothetical protein
MGFDPEREGCGEEFQVQDFQEDLGMPFLLNSFPVIDAKASERHGIETELMKRGRSS